MDENIKKALSNIPPDKLEALLSSIEKSTGAKKEEVIDSVSNEQTSAKLNALLGMVDKKKLNAVLSDQAALDQLLSTPRAKALLKNLMGK